MPRTLTALALIASLWPLAPAAQTAPAKGTATAPAPAADPLAILHDVIARHFPAEAAALQAQLAQDVALARAAGRPEPTGFEHGRALLVRLAPNLGGAADADLIAILSDQIALYTALAGRPGDCARVMVDGMRGADIPVILQSGHDIAGATDRLYAAMAAGQGQPRRPAATQAQYNALIAALGPMDQAIALIRTIERQDRAEPALCPASIAFLQTVRDARFAGADALRAEILGLLFGA